MKNIKNKKQIMPVKKETNRGVDSFFVDEKKIKADSKPLKLIFIFLFIILLGALALMIYKYVELRKINNQVLTQVQKTDEKQDLLNKINDRTGVCRDVDALRGIHSDLERVWDRSHISTMVQDEGKSRAYLPSASRTTDASLEHKSQGQSGTSASVTTESSQFGSNFTSGTQGQSGSSSSAGSTATAASTSVTATQLLQKAAMNI